MKLRLSFVFLALSLLFLSCGSSFSQEGEGYVAVDLYDFVQKISSRSAGTEQNVNVTLWTEGDYVTSVTASVNDSGSNPIILSDIPIKSSISINLEASVGKKNYLGASEKIVVQKGKNPVTIKLTKTLPTTDIVLYNQTSNGYSYYLANSDGSNINSPSLFFEPDYGPADFCFDADGNIYLSTNMDVNSFFFYNGVIKDNRGRIEVLDPDDQEVQITSGKLAYDFAKRQVWEVSSGRCYKFSALSQSDSEWFDYKTKATVYNYRTTDLGVLDSVVAACVNDEIAYVVFNTDGGNTPFLLAEYDISSAVVDEENEDEFSIGMPRKTLPLCGGMDMSYYAEISDMLYQDGAVYILVRDYFEKETLISTYSRGEIIKYDIATGILSYSNAYAPTKTMTTFKAACSYNGASIIYNSKDNTDYYIEQFTCGTDPSSISFYAPFNNSDSYFTGPQKFIAIKPKKLVISDTGLAFYTNAEGAITYKNINRVIEVDLKTLSMTDITDAGVDFITPYTYRINNTSGLPVKSNVNLNQKYKASPGDVITDGDKITSTSGKILCPYFIKVQ